MKKNILFFFAGLILLTTSCAHKETLDANQIIDKSIKAHGADLLAHATMDFKFRDATFSITRENGTFEYTKRAIVNENIIKDVLTNQTSMRYINDVPQQLADSVQTRYTNSLNSVVYFAQLPYSLDGSAVYKELLGDKHIKGTDYYKVKVSFDPNGGGEDHEDEFIYWINQHNFLVDYMAYSYCEVECGYRFRQSVNTRVINGITVQDYKNYKEKVQDPDLTQMDAFFINGELELLSEIQLEDVTVKIRK